MSGTQPQPSWSGLKLGYEDNDLAKQAAYLKTGALYSVATEAAKRGKELTELRGKELDEANLLIEQHPDAFKNFANLPPRGGKKTKSKKNKMKSRRNKTKKNKTKRNKKRR